MNILNEDSLNEQLDRYVLGVFCVVKDFTKLFEQNSLPVIIDPLKEFNLCAWASERGLAYIDMADAHDYESLANSLFDLGCRFVMDNIDSIPDGPDKEYLEELVRFILKKEMDFPLPNGKMVDFSKCECAMRANSYPEYLRGKSICAIWLRIPEPGKEMEYTQLFS